MSLGFSKDSRCECASRQPSSECYGIELKQVQHIVYVNALEVEHEGIHRIFGSQTCHDDMLVVVMDGEMIHREMVFAVHDVRRLDIPDAVFNQYLRRMDGDVGCRLTILFLEELCRGVQGSLKRMGGMIVKPQCGEQVVVGGRGSYPPGPSLVLSIQLIGLCAEVQRVGWRGQV